jgi:hypothetical protein
MSFGCFGFGSHQQTNELRLVVAEQKAEIESLNRENKKLAAQIESQKQIPTGENPVSSNSGRELNRFHLQVRELETQLEASTALRQPERVGQAETSKADLDVRVYLERQGHDFLQRLFNQFAELVSMPGDTSLLEGLGNSKSKIKAMLKPTGLQKALLELGVQMDYGQVEKLFASNDLDDKGGLDFEEFKRAVLQPATPLEQWVAMLPINGMLARSFPIRDGPGDQTLRNVSRLGTDGIHATVDAFSAALRRVLLEAQVNLQQMFGRVDDKAAEAAMEGAVTAVSKFKTFKMSTGTVKDYVEGISSRVGMYLALCNNCDLLKN